MHLKSLVSPIDSYGLILIACCNMILVAQFSVTSNGLLRIPVSLIFLVLTSTYALGLMGKTYPYRAVPFDSCAGRNFQPYQIHPNLIAAVCSLIAAFAFYLLCAQGQPHFGVICRSGLNGHDSASLGGYLLLASQIISINGMALESIAASLVVMHSLCIVSLIGLITGCGLLRAQPIHAPSIHAYINSVQILKAHALACSKAIAKPWSAVQAPSICQYNQIGCSMSSRYAR